MVLTGLVIHNNSEFMKYLTLSFPGIEKAYAVDAPRGGIEKARDLMRVAVEMLLIVAVVLSIFFVIKGGYNIIMSSGNKEHLQNGRRAVMWGLIGLVAALMSFAAMKTITVSIFGS